MPHWVKYLVLSLQWLRLLLSQGFDPWIKLWIFKVTKTLKKRKERKEKKNSPYLYGKVPLKVSPLNVPTLPHKNTEHQIYLRILK